MVRRDQLLLIPIWKIDRLTSKLMSAITKKFYSSITHERVAHKRI